MLLVVELLLEIMYSVLLEVQILEMVLEEFLLLLVIILLEKMVVLE